MTSGTSTSEREALLTELSILLGEAPKDSRKREDRLRLELESHHDAPIVLFGAGNLGRRTLSLLRSRGHDVAAFMDNDSDRWGTDLDGVPVLAPDDASSRYASNGLAVVTIWRAEGGHDFLATRADLRKRGWSRVESFIPLFWGYGSDALPYITIDLPTKVLAARDAVMAAADLWADERSLRDYVSQVRWRLSGDFAVLTPVEPDQYFAQGVVRVGQDEVFVDCGAFTGDTLLEVARRFGSWRAYHAFEPDPESFLALEAAVSSLPATLADTVRLHQAATADRRSTALFTATGLGSASLSADGTYQVDCVTIDETITGMPPTFIKMDIEGAEAATLTGSRKVIGAGRPLLAVAAYHKQADLWELPQLVHDMMPDYHMFLRPHVAEGFDTVLYAVPPERLVES